MTTQPEALRLADLLCKDGHECCDFQAAAELRRLANVEAQRDALLKALKAIEPILARMYGQQAADLPPMQIVRAAIKAVEETK